MAAKPIEAGEPVMQFVDAMAWESWLAEHH